MQKIKGFTLIEVVIAIAILAFTVASATAVAISASRTNSEAGRRTQASTLASMEMEALRSFRDYNAREQNDPWAGLALTQVINGKNCRQFVMQPDTSAPQLWSIHNTTAALEFTATDPDNVYPGDIYGHYRRLITLCGSPGNPPLNTDDIRSVKVVVEWYEGAESNPAARRTVEFNSLLTAWRQQ